MNKIKDLIKKIPFFGKFMLEIKLRLEFYKDSKFFLKNYSKSKENSKKIEYNILLITHSLEKGMSNLNPRPFGVDKIYEIMELVKKYETYSAEMTYAYMVAINSLREYNNFYKVNNWDFTKANKDVEKFLEKYEHVPEVKVGSHIITKQDYNTDVDYYNFLKSRHSVRNFSSKKLLKKDINKAISIALLSPTACNRQMCKIYNILTEENKKLVTQYAQGLGNFELDNINYFIITFDVNALYFMGERSQGYFNAGLVAMNFVNALHSLGIGSCFVQFGNNFKQESFLKNKLNIGSSERIAVIVTAGYYADKSKIPYSPRKKVEDIYFER